MKKNILITLADSGYVEQAKQLFSGAYFNAAWKGEMMLLAHAIPEGQLRWFRDRGILIYECDEIDIQSQMQGKWPPIVLHKFHLLKPHFRQWNTIVFLDADIIIRSSLDGLIGVQEFSAVQCHRRLSAEFLGRFGIFLRKLDPRLLPEIKRSYSMKHPAFNSGMFAFPSDLIRESSFEELVGLQERYGSISKGAEEAALNLYFHTWKSLSETYNAFPDLLLTTTHIRPDQIRGSILHFILHKPWIPEHPFYNEWKANYDKADDMGMKVKTSETQPTSSESNSESDRDMKAYEKSLQRYRRKGAFKALRRAAFGVSADLTGYAILSLQGFFPKLYRYLKDKKEKR